jgi:transcription termination factor NusB
MVDMGMFKDLEDEVHRLQSALQKLGDEYANGFKNLQDQINKKADKEQLLELEARIMEKLNEMLKRLLGNFADRNDTMKRLANLEKNVRSTFVYEVIVQESI